MNENQPASSASGAAAEKPSQRVNSPESAELLQVRLTARSGRNIADMAAMTGIKNKTQLANAAIDLASDIMRTIDKGGIVTYENPDGTKVQLKVVGVG